MGDEELDDATNEEQDLQHYLLEQVEKQSAKLSDLVEYLERTDPNFAMDVGNFESWQVRLEQMRQVEYREKQIADARRTLEMAGYLVAKDPNGLDAARVKKWVESKKQDFDDDIPF